MSIFAPRLRTSTIRRSELAKVGPVSVPVLRRDFRFLARPATELCPGLGRLAARPAVAALLAARFASRLIQHVPSATSGNQRVHRRRPFPSFRNGRVRRAELAGTQNAPPTT